MIAAAPRPRLALAGAAAALWAEHGTEAVVSGPAGTGKTYACLWRAHLCAARHPGARVLLLRKVQEDLTSSALVTFQERVLGAGHFGVRPFGGSKLKPAGFQYPNGSEVLVGGLDKPTKVMSREYDLVYVNEATELAEDEWERLTTRVRWGAMLYQQVYGDCNPAGPTHWLHRRHFQRGMPMFFATHEENPELHDGRDWTPRGVAYLAQLDRLSGHLRDRLRYGRWVAAEGAVYPAFDRRRHVASVDTAGWRVVLGVDVGHRNPTAVLTVAAAADERRHVRAELYRAGLSASEIVAAVADAYRAAGAESCFVDPSAAAYLPDLQSAGVRVVPANNDVLKGLAVVSGALEEGLTLDPSCERTAEEFESYRYPDNRRESDKPEKKNDHAMDALRYALMGLHEGPPLMTTAYFGEEQANRWGDGFASDVFHGWG